MIMPNIKAFIAWSIITAFFIPKGWTPNEKIATLVEPMVYYLLPILIAYSGSSCEVQIALITSRIKYLTEHFQTHIKDHHFRRGLLKLVGQRRNLLKYLQKKDITKYRDLIQALGIRK